MRITGGELCSRKIRTPPGSQVRPTQDRVREALFSMLEPIVPGSLFVDLYAGSGVVGLEALSRGAERVIWVERDIRHVRVIRENAAMLPGRGEVVCADVERWLKGAQSALSADIVFMDPPYATTLVEKLYNLMITLIKQGVIRCGGWFVAEMESSCKPDELTGWELWRDRVYGHTRIVVYKNTMR